MRTTALAWSIVSCALLATPAFAVALSQASAGASGLDAEASRRIVTLEGFVVGSDGTPEHAALVVSSAGGKAVTDAAGTYRLELALPRSAASVQVTAVANGGGRLASASVALSAASTTRVDPLVLAAGTACSREWLPTFGAQPGTGLAIHALTVFDDGGGPALYAGGSFEIAGAVVASRIAKWDGASWAPLGTGLSGSVHALAVYDDGSGPALYAGGIFSSAGSVTVNKIARWDGASWSALGSGVGGTSAPGVHALAVFDDGSGPALYVGGDFALASGTSASRIARWDGSGWSSLGSGVAASFAGEVASVLALAVHDDGTGPALFAGGSFVRAGGVANRNGIAKWDGSAWSGLGSGTNAPVRALASFDGGGARLYAGGDFTTAGGAPASRIARWDGASWSAPGGGTSGPVHALRVRDDGSGPALYAGGEFATADGVAVNGIARWDGAGWSALGGGTTGISSEDFPAVKALAEFDAGGGPALFAAGYLQSAGGIPANSIARWDGAWSVLDTGLARPVFALAVHDDGGGPALYVGGTFWMAGGIVVNGVGRWDGTSWSALGSGVETTVAGRQASVQALVVHDDGSGAALYAGGSFQIAGGVPANHVARWDGSSWSALGSGVAGMTSSLDGVDALASYDDGSGAALYAGGAFTSAGGSPANRVARWDGSSWHPLGSGTSGVVYALAGYDDGSGPALYAAGQFVSAGGLTVNCVARWNGASWSALGSGLIDTSFLASVVELVPHDDGSGPALYAGGRFFIAGDVLAHGVARWQNGSWSRVSLVPDVTLFSLASLDDGTGPALYAGGYFLGMQGIGKWDGSSWTMLSTPVARALPGISANALLFHDDGGGLALFAAGTSIDSGDSFLSKWGPPAVDLDPPELSCPVSVEVLDDLGGPSGEVVTFAVVASDCRDPAPSVVCVPSSGSLFPRGTTLVTCTATDAAGNQSTCEFPVTVALKARRR